ncbi:MAG TPA: sulfite reductase subunit alpha [Opitutaceae bacterium]|nr:sulfite reductase subunit alpha [Opitutaceae bacterium]
MSTLPVIPESAPFTLEQRAWLNGYLAGLFSRAPAPTGLPLVAPGGAAAAAPLVPLTILFGSQTGSAEGLAKRAAKEAGKRGFAATVVDMAQTDLARLGAEKNVLVITSTYGDGEPPDNAKALHAALSAASGGTPLASLRYAVCALGDTNYTQFCKCGKDFDALLEKLGARRIAERAECDLDYEAKFSAWLEQALTGLQLRNSDCGLRNGTEDGRQTADGRSAEGLKSGGPEGPRTESAIRSPQAAFPAPQSELRNAWGRSRPFPALLLTSRSLSGDGSAKQVNHVEFSLEGSGMSYAAGDALGVYPHNCPELVADVLAELGCDGEEAVSAPDGGTTSLRHALTELYDLGKPTPELLAHFGGGGGNTAVALPHVIDVLLARADVKLAPGEFVRGLKRLQPRLYSISSSPNAHAEQVHLTVGAVRYEIGARTRKGVCSTFLADRVVPDTTRVGVFVHTNGSFRPPADGDTPMIMIGPGTGIAPFRGFLHERRATGARGRNWLFFGDQREATDFLYRDELRGFESDGLLTRLSLAWSRDQQEKIYVQNRMLDHAAELYAWLEDGAHVYVCGDASRMAKDVDAALHRIIERAGGKSAEQAAEYVAALRAAKRYCRDVY